VINPFSPVLFSIPGLSCLPPSIHNNWFLFHTLRCFYFHIPVDQGEHSRQGLMAPFFSLEKGVAASPTVLQEGPKLSCNLCIPLGDRIWNLGNLGLGFIYIWKIEEMFVEDGEVEDGDKE
jgi:hypothetical protein